MVDTDTKKFIVEKFLDYKMIDSKTIITQMQELHVLLYDICSENMKLRGLFQVVAIIENLPLLYRDFKNYPKHKCKEMNLGERIVELRIEKDNRKTKRKSGIQFGQVKAHREKSNSRINKKRKVLDDVPKRDKDAKKFKCNCYNSGKTGHRSSEYQKAKKNVQANVIERDALSEGIQQMKFSKIVSKCNNVGIPRKCQYGCCLLHLC